MRAQNALLKLDAVHLVIFWFINFLLIFKIMFSTESFPRLQGNNFFFLLFAKFIKSNTLHSSEAGYLGIDLLGAGIYMPRHLGTKRVNCSDH